MAHPLRIIFVTDPMCSWCWGMANAIEQVRYRLDGFLQFDFWVGGLNLNASTPLTEAALPRFQELWRRVEETTGATYSMRLPAPGFIYNSRNACRAVHAMRELTDAPPFDFLHALQRRFFVEAEDIGRIDVLADTVRELGGDVPKFHAAFSAVDEQALQREFAACKAYGTNALPSVLGETVAGRRLIAGGYLDGSMLEDLLRGWRDRHAGLSQ